MSIRSEFWGDPTPSCGWAEGNIPMETTVLRNNFALRKVANRYPLRRHITAFFATLLVIAMLALGAFAAWQIFSLLSLPDDQKELGVNRIIWMLVIVSALL